MSGIIGYMLGEGLLGNSANNTGPLVVDGMGTWSGGTDDMLLGGMGGYTAVDLVIATGVDFAASDRRPHCTVSNKRPHYRAADRRPHYTVS
jgi:hypothetical protein